MRRVHALLLFGVISAFSAFGNGTAHDRVYDGIIAIVNGEIITKADLEERTRLAILSMGGSISESMKPRIQQDVLHEMCTERLQWCLTEKYVSFTPHKCWVTQREIDESFAGIAARNNMTLDQFRAVLKKCGISEECLRKQIRCNLAWIAFIRSKYGSSVQVSDTELRKLREDYYKHKNEQMYFVQRIFVPAADSDDDREALVQVRNITALLDHGVAFEEAARQFSKGIEAQRGGNIGWIYAGQLGREEANAIRRLDVDSVAAVKTNRGYVILKLKGKRVSHADTVTYVKFVQVALPLDKGYPREQLEQFLGQLKAAYPTAHALVQGARGRAFVSEPEAAALDELNPKFLKLVENLNAGDISGIYAMNGAVFVICMLDRKVQKIKDPTDEDFENKKIEEKMSSLSERDLQYLRKIAVIEIKDKSYLQAVK